MSLFGTPRDHEVSDVIVAHDPETLERTPVRKQELLKLFENNQRAALIVAQIPEREGFLDCVAVDRLLLKVHWEMQRLSQEFNNGTRLLELLLPVFAPISRTEFTIPRALRDECWGNEFSITLYD